MDFGLSDEQLQLQSVFRDVVAKEDPPQKRREVFGGEHAHDPLLWRGLMELGAGGVLVPEEQGGTGLRLLDAVLISEVLGETAFLGARKR